jgi:hypothetical protein
MYHTIEFVTDLCVDLERSRNQPLERLLLLRGMRRRVQIRPHVLETPTGPVEVADLFFEDGTACRDVWYDRFEFAD